jgi:hypothetical protein
MSQRFAIVITTINVPRLLGDYLADFAQHGRDASVIVVADVNTPVEAEDYCRELAAEGAAVDYWSPERQRSFLREFPDLDQLLPWRSIQRRNLGYLLAWRSGADVIVSMDDDNFLHSADFLGAHSIVGTRVEVPCVSSEDGWWNVCELLRTKPARRFYHRGHPISRRWSGASTSVAPQTGRVVVNAGLWLKDPDVDTITRLEEPFEVVGLASPVPHTGAARGTWTPFNSQNTAILSDLLPFLYLVVAPDELRGHRASFRNFRYDDIWMSYFARLAIDRMQDLVTYGEPLVVQERNVHNYLFDVDRELVPMYLTETLVEVLRGLELTSSDYPAMWAELVESLRRAFTDLEGLDPRERRFLLGIVDGMAIWRDACERIMK